MIITGMFEEAEQTVVSERSNADREDRIGGLDSEYEGVDLENDSYYKD